MFLQAFGEQDDARRQQIINAMQRLLWADGGWILWGFGNWVDGLGPKVRGIKPGKEPLGTVRMDTAWLAA